MSFPYSTPDDIDGIVYSNAYGKNDLKTTEPQNRN